MRRKLGRNLSYLFLYCILQDLENKILANAIKGCSLVCLLKLFNYFSILLQFACVSGAHICVGQKCSKLRLKMIALGQGTIFIRQDTSWISEVLSQKSSYISVFMLAIGSNHCLRCLVNLLVYMLLPFDWLRLLSLKSAFSPLRIRIGGSLQDQVLYKVGTLAPKCPHFKRRDDGLFGFSKGCLDMNRWDLLNKLFNRTG